MKVLITLALTLLSLFTHLQMQARSVNSDTCIDQLRPLKFKPVDNQTILVYKAAIPDFIARLKDCQPDYKYAADYQDRAFEITVPKYFKWENFDVVRSGSQFGDGNFQFLIYQHDDTVNRRIEIAYDFQDKDRNGFFQRIADKKLEVITKEVNGRTIYYYRNFDGFYIGRIHLDRNTIVYYATMDEKYTPELEKAILSFKWF